jgi:hypothetical protein
VDHCSFNRGGLFNDSLSTSWKNPPMPSAAEFRPADKGGLSVAAFGADTILLSNSIDKLTDFAFFTPISGDLPQSGLGLGRNGTFLESLFVAGKIASRTWSLFWGLEGGDTFSTMDGSLTLGDYDIAKTIGPNSTQSFSSLADITQCPSCSIVFIADILVKHPNGTSISLFGDAKGTALRTCIKPDIPLITFPSDIWSAFSAAIGGTYIGASNSYKLWGMNYAAQCIFDGDLQFVLSSGLELTIPNGQLVVPDVQVDDEGQTFISNHTIREILVYNLEDSNVNDMPLLGQAFLTSGYMHVDNEREQFTLWQVKLTTEEDLVAVQSASLSACNSTSATPSASSKRQLSAGAIAGIVLGALLVVAIGLVLLYLLRRRHGGQTLNVGRRESLLYDTHKEMVLTGWGPANGYENVWRSQPPCPAVGMEARGAQEAGGTQIHEMHPGDTSRYELTADIVTKSESYRP